MKTALIVGGVVVVALVLLAQSGGRDTGALADDDVEGGAGTRPAGGASSGGAGVFTDGGGSGLARFKPSLSPGLAPRFGNLAALSLARQVPTAPRAASALLTRAPRLPVPRSSLSRLTGE